MGLNILSTNIDSPIANVETNLGTLTWAAGVAPSGTISKTYRFFTAGKQVSFMAKITTSVAGTAVLSVSFPLPTDVPVPALWGAQSANSLIIVGTGSLTADITGTPLGVAGLYADGSGGYVVKAIVAAVAATNVNIAINWLSS